MKWFFSFIFLTGQVWLNAQVQDIEVFEERGSSEIKLYAVNQTDAELDMTFTAILTGFISKESSPIKKILKPRAKEFLMTLTAPSGVACEYKTSVSYKKVRKEGDTAGQGKKQRMTGIQINANKINVFTQDGCARCEFIISHLEKNKIPFLELNTNIHQPNQQLMFEKLEEAGFKGSSVQMPVIVQNGKTTYDIKDLATFVKNLK
jgi:glutaredoxin